MSEVREFAEKVRRLAHQAVTEGVDLRYVDRIRKALYEASDELIRVEAEMERLRAEMERKDQLWEAILDSENAEPCWDIARVALFGWPANPKGPPG